MLDLDVFWAERLPPSRKGTRWDLVVFVLASYRLIARAVSGGYTGSGSDAQRLAICWAWMRASPIRTCSTAAMIACSSISKLYLRI